jgi:acetoin utilization deacetylase AcuC-like enzyme
MITSLVTDYKRFIIVDYNFDVNFGDLMQKCHKAKIDLFVISVYNKPEFSTVYSFRASNQKHTAILSNNGVIMGIIRRSDTNNMI